MRYRWDIFCKVIDNFGDAGVCWRLARQLVTDFHQEVRLWIDDLDTLGYLTSRLNRNLLYQEVQGVTICHWQAVQAEVVCADIVIEAFACDLPDFYITAMLQNKKQPVWINLEYLSAEPWVARYHLLPSPHPRLPLIKFFFFPGFVKGTGGLLRERTLKVRQYEFDKTAKQAFIKRSGLLERESGSLWISLFCYETAPLEKLIHVLSESPRSTLLIVPEGNIANRILVILKDASALTAKLIVHKRLSIQIIPFLEQADYDHLLWCCDINFVRGEDSFVRAQWAAKLFVWNIYRQQERAHLKKMDAFLELYTASMPVPMAIAVKEMWSCWNGRGELHAEAWMNFLAFRESLMQHNEDWINQLMAQEDLGANLVQFVENRL
ncbi:elongation factor P maturation arginine rhamnosyltransferase EarP [Nitrosomonas sp.]|uniref:elongation factor P maturation arginine rhamnosyltransferase EarP n=1 Tax=Nitrosomonas sp. TaxID=42353 RepID=UPI001DC564D0|nr:elongation factor P maturation arginine rhamnosyltransferase EarP [Nitrosomonas sp.]MBX3616041.1 elongation factor P maturation arginine rhamnosyltransferase EarP [Nitrosomonas sp.]